LIPATPANRQAMARKWAEIRAKNYVEFEFTTNVMGETKTAMVQAPDSGASYRFYRKNCSVIVQRVLKAGGLKRSWTDFFHQKSTIWTPLNVKRLAMTYAGARTVTWGAFLTDLRDRARLTDEAYALLVGFERRTLDHGSSGALPHHFMGLKSTQSVEANRDAIRKL
jgi:hypothetical protein